ncbi:hypothetical protein KIPB_001510 [Kipferlia bialata]|uniref:Uncharacterized protein n=1 Tax=Kipferlia bialata TaxID=797122 RepID=A0A9K3CQE5_9EUKA|nr:hypothetical protein KIPB_001510 [Kipferlia bialata]|eukprot:g1510.t1
MDQDVGLTPEEVAQMHYLECLDHINERTYDIVAHVNGLLYREHQVKRHVHSMQEMHHKQTGGKPHDKQADMRAFQEFEYARALKYQERGEQ